MLRIFHTLQCKADSAAKTHLLEIHIVLCHFDFLIQEHFRLLRLQIVAEQRTQCIDHLLRRHSILQICHSRYYI